MVDAYEEYGSFSNMMDDNPGLSSQTEAQTLPGLIILTGPPAIPPAIYQPAPAEYVNGDTILNGQYVLQYEQAAEEYVGTGSASQVFGEYVDAGGEVSQFSKSATAYVPAVLYGPAVYLQYLTGWSLGSILTVASTTVNCGMAALIGYSIGTDLYELNPDLWEEFFRTVAPWTFDLIDDHCGVVDFNGKTYVDSRLFNAFQEKFSEIVPPIQYNKVTSNGIRYSSGARAFRVGNTYTKNGTSISVYGKITAGSENNVVFAKPSSAYNRTLYFGYTGPQLTLSDGQYVGPGSGELGFNIGPSRYYSYTKNGQTVYFGVGNIAAIGSNLPFPSNQREISYSPTPDIIDNDTVNFQKIGEALWYIEYGDSEDVEFPDGVSQWEGNVVANPYNGAINVAVDENGNTVQFIPFSLPYDGDGYLDSTKNPNPQQYTDAFQQVAPYVNPSISSYKDLGIQADSESDPSLNPSQTGTSPGTTTSPVTPVAPADAGTSPVIPANITPAPFNPSASTPSGLVNVYNPTAQNLYDFGSWLWVAYTNVTLQKILNNPFDGVISLHEIYFTPVTGSTQQIRSGFLDSGVYSATVPQRYSQLNCGSIVVPEHFGNYLDYSPYTKVYIYLPFVGVQELDAEDVIGAAINVTYGLDSYSGACVAMITTAKDGYEAVTYQFSGNASVQHPITGGSQVQNLIAQLSTVGSAIGGLLSGGIGGAITEGLESFMDLTKVKSSVYHSGSFVGNFGAMSCKTPYLIVKRPRQVIVPNYNELYGYPAHKYVKLGSCTGYVRCREVHVNSARATNEEKQRIEELLKSGVYLT